MATLCTALFLLLAFIVGPTTAGDYCYNRNDYSSRKYCSGGCCGSYGYEYCCTTYLATGSIVGVVFACVTVVGIIIGIVCCCVKSKSHAGVVVQPGQSNPGAGVTVVNTSQNSNTAWQSQPGPYGQPQGYAYAGYAATNAGYAGPPTYGQQPPPGPPAYSDPAYPPGQGKN